MASINKTEKLFNECQIIYKNALVLLAFKIFLTRKKILHFPIRFDTCKMRFNLIHIISTNLAKIHRIHHHFNHIYKYFQQINLTLSPIKSHNKKALQIDYKNYYANKIFSIFLKIKSSKGILCFECISMISYLIFRSKFCHLVDIINR